MGLRIKIELFTFPFVRAEIVKSAYFWLFVNEVILAAWNHLAHAQHEVFVSDPTWHPSEVRMLLWLWCLQEVLRATKNLAKIIHKSIMNTKTLPTTEQLPDLPGTFLWAPGCTWKKNHQRPRQREAICYHSSNLACFYFSKITVCNMWVFPCCFIPLQEWQPWKPPHYIWASICQVEW